MKAIICDLDGSLMPPSSGLYVSEKVKEKLIEIQKHGIMVVLNSARIIQGVYLPKIAEKPLDMRTTQGRQQNENFYHRR